MADVDSFVVQGGTRTTGRNAGRPPVELVVEDVADFVAALREHGIGAATIRRPVVSARRIRQDLDLSQNEFAVRFDLKSGRSRIGSKIAISWTAAII